MWIEHLLRQEAAKSGVQLGGALAAPVRRASQLRQPGSCLVQRRVRHRLQAREEAVSETKNENASTEAFDVRPTRIGQGEHGTQMGLDLKS